MISASLLLSDCQRLVRRLEDDLRERLASLPALEAPVRAEFERAQEGHRTGQSYGVWRDEYLTQVAVHWVLAAVFVRFLEDNELLPEPWLSGPGPRRALAQERHDRFFAEQPAASDREVLLACFHKVQHLPAMAPLFDERHNPIFRLGPSADGAREIVDLFRKVDSATGDLVHNFVDPSWNTRFLGDLYQDLSESARKRFALLQTPEFVEEFILDRTLDRAMEEVGYQKVKLIDPACGSGHFLLGAFRRLFARWLRDEPGTNVRELARRTLTQIAGVDVNPFAVAIARFRLLIAALQVSEVTRLTDAPAFPLNLAAGDSLLHGPRPGSTRGLQIPLIGKDPLAHVYETEDRDELRRILGQSYDVVVANPPYITPKDAAENQAYRDRFGSCHRQYSLAVPFTERCFDLAASAESGRPAGWVGMITSNSFMKREFGKKLIETFLPSWDLTHVVDTSGAFIPGHLTPTVILIGRNQSPLAQTVRAVMGIRGEPSTPANPATGLVWSAIVAQIDLPGSQSEFISVADVPRKRFQIHPWSIGGGGVSDLKELIEAAAATRLSTEISEIGFGAVTRADDAFMVSAEVALRHQIPQDQVRPLVPGEAIRDWTIVELVGAIWPYDMETLDATSPEGVVHFLWPFRTELAGRVAYGQTQVERGLAWFEYSMFFRGRYRVPLSIAFAFVATHNHFVLDRGGKVFNRTAPVVKLSATATETDHLALLGVLNSSTACFWMKQIFYPKATSVGDISIDKSKPEANRYEFVGTQLLEFPMPARASLADATFLASRLDELSQGLSSLEPRNIVANWKVNGEVAALSDLLGKGESETRKIRKRMTLLQEELDWEIYKIFGLASQGASLAVIQVEDLGIEPHDRPAFWCSENPPESIEPLLRTLFSQRRALIEGDQNLAMLETPVYKRLWLGQQGVFGHSTSSYQDRVQAALRSWLLDRLEDRRYWPEPRIVSTARLADQLRKDDEFRQIAALYRGRDSFDWTELITELVLDEAVPFLAAYRYTDAGLRKRAEWEETWRLQRLEDAIDAEAKSPDEAKKRKEQEVGTIPVPPRYGSADFRKSTYWRLRGKLDVPKERFIHYPGLEKDGDASPVIGWAGWNHLEQAQAVGTAFHELREKEAWTADRLAPLLAGLLELLPWLQQWHNEPDPAHGGLRLGDYFAGFLDEEARTLGLTRESLAAWKPEAKKGRGRKAKSE